MKQKLMAVMLERNGQRKLSGLVQIDDAYLGGEMRVKRGRQARTRLAEQDPFRRRGRHP